MSIYNPKKRRPLSQSAATTLRAIIAESDATGLPATVPGIVARTGQTDRAVYSALHVLADRWLIVIDGRRIRPRQRGRDLLRSAFYRDRDGS